MDSRMPEIKLIVVLSLFLLVVPLQADDRPAEPSLGESGKKLSLPDAGMRDDSRASMKPQSINAKTPAGDARKLLAEMAEELEQANFKGVVAYLAWEDRKRIGTLSDTQLAKFTSSAAKFRETWQQKFNSKFTLNSPLEQERALVVDLKQNENGDVATLRIPANLKAPEIKLDLAREGFFTKSYRTNISDSIDGQALADSLASQLRALVADKDSWPSDKLEASRMVVQRMAQGLLG